MLGAVTSSPPTQRQVGELKNARVMCDHCLQTYHPTIFAAGVATADEMPRVIVGVVRNDQDWLGAVQYLPYGNCVPVSRLVERPILTRIVMM